MKYNFCYDDEDFDDFDDEIYQNKIKTHKHHISKEKDDDNELKHLNKEKTKNKKKSIKEKYQKYEIENE